LAAQRLILVLVGPTAGGKTRLALALAARTGAEVLSADMGQLYRVLDAGTAKPPGAWVGGRFLAEAGPARIPYHLVDVLDPADATDAGRYAAMADPILGRLSAAGAPVIVAGGTGLYLRALLEGLDPLPKGDAALRERIAARIRSEGGRAAHQELQRRDPEAARRIPPGNTQRLVRALEVLELTGKPISSFWNREKPPRYRTRVIGLSWDAAALKERIRERAAAMFPDMLREVRGLVPGRYRGGEPGFRCLGYPEALACARGELAPAAALAGMIRATNAYAKRQRTWFRRQTPAEWLPGDAPLRALEEAALRSWNA